MLLELEAAEANVTLSSPGESHLGAGGEDARRAAADPSLLWSVRVSRADAHHTLLPLRVFPDASPWELKVLLAGVTRVPPAEIVLHLGRYELTGGALSGMTARGARNYCTLVMSRRRCAGSRGPPAVISEKAFAAHVQQLPQRRFMSEDLRAAVLALARGEDASGEALRLLQLRLRCGESVEAVDHGTGMTALQLALVHGTTPALAVMLVQQFAARVAVMVEDDTSLFSAGAATARAPTSDAPVPATTGLCTLPLALACRRLELLSFVPRAAARTPAHILQEPLILERLERAHEMALQSRGGAPSGAQTSRADDELVDAVAHVLGDARRLLALSC